MSEVTDLIMPVLRRIQSDVADLKIGQERLDQKVDGLNDGMDAFEGYFTYTMGLTGRNSADIETLKVDVRDLRRRFETADPKK